MGLVGAHELPKPVRRVDRVRPHGNADAPDVLTAQGRAHGRLDLIAPEGPEGFPFLGNVREREAGAFQEVFPDVDVVAPQPHRQHVEATPARGPVENPDAVERVPLEQRRHDLDRVREVNQPTFVGPSLVKLGIDHREDEVGCAAAGFERGHESAHKLLLWAENKLDIFSGVGLEGSDDLRDGFVLL